MKKIIIISILALAALNTNAQSSDAAAKCKKAPNMPANAVPAWPKSAYTPAGDPSCAPCYTYKTKRGLEVMECPFAYFPAEHSNSTYEAPVADVNTMSTVNTLEVQAQNTYTGNYPGCPKMPNMPKNAKLVYPKSAYTPTGDPSCAPCYEYTTKRGLEVMECPHLWFPPEHNNQ